MSRVTSPGISEQTLSVTDKTAVAARSLPTFNVNVTIMGPVETANKLRETGS